MSCPFAATATAADAAACPFLAATKQKKDSITDSNVDPSQIAHLTDIPHPPEHMFGLLGNLPDIDPNFPFRNMWDLIKIYGPIMKLKLDTDRIFVSSQALVNEICDDDRFEKAHLNVLEEVRALLHDGLFTAYNHEGNWAKAHRMLVPHFGPIGVRKMWSGMQDIASQMILKWDRLGPQHEIDCSDDLTRLAFDTIGLCAFSFRFNQFYLQDVHPFAQQMSRVLFESGRKANRPTIIQPLYRSAENQRQDDVVKMHALCDEIVAERKAHPQPDNNDLLNVMLNAVDRETGESLSDTNIRYQLATFLVAGHETTSATLSFCYYHLLKNPEKLVKAQKEVDDVVGDSVLSLEHVPKLEFIDACIKETQRISSTINGSSRSSKTDQIIGGKYLIPAGKSVTWINYNLHRDTKVWGNDVDTFRPERFLNGGFQRLPPNSFKPFGTGPRACIGRAFAIQEMIMNVAMVLQRFQLELVDPSYELNLKATLTIKPAGFKMRARRRADKAVWSGLPGGVQKYEQTPVRGHERQLHSTENPKPLNIFFAGNSGTCEAFAQSLRDAAKDAGLEPTIQNLDAATENLPKGLNAIIASSYEGHPPDNAKKFVAWLESLPAEGQSFRDREVAVFGVGNSDWVSTYHRIPKLIHELASKQGASSIVEPGFVNVKEDPVGPWEDWLDELISAMAGKDEKPKQQQTAVQIKVEPAPANEADEESGYGTVIVNKTLADNAVGPSKRHIEIRLSNNMSYSAGDYLVVRPHNHSEDVHKVAAYFNLGENDTITISGSSKKHLPTEPTTVGNFLSRSVELGTPVTKRQLEVIVKHAPSDRQADVAKLSDTHSNLLSKRYSILDVLVEHDLTLPFEEYIDMLQPLTARQYSISSSSLVNPTVAALTIDVHEGPALSGHGTFHGVASSYLASRAIGDRISCTVRPTQIGFRLPPPAEPLIMIAAGTGIAPMRAFLEERAAMAAGSTQRLGKALLYFGCRHAEKDFLYREQLAEWERLGVVTVKPAFSRMDGEDHDDNHHHHRYVPDAMWEGRDEVADLFKGGAKIFLCGSAARLGQSTGEVCKRIYRERLGKSVEESDRWLAEIKTSRYISDVY